eukprot:5214791-Lingulodinium_polyedra.AAC.1
MFRRRRLTTGTQNVLPSTSRLLVSRLSIPTAMSAVWPSGKPWMRSSSAADGRRPPKPAGPSSLFSRRASMRQSAWHG